MENYLCQDPDQGLACDTVQEMVGYMGVGLVLVAAAAAALIVWFKRRRARRAQQAARPLYAVNEDGVTVYNMATGEAICSCSQADLPLAMPKDGTVRAMYANVIARALNETAARP